MGNLIYAHFDCDISTSWNCENYKKHRAVELLILIGQKVIRFLQWQLILYIISIVMDNSCGTFWWRCLFVDILLFSNNAVTSKADIY